MWETIAALALGPVKIHPQQLEMQVVLETIPVTIRTEVLATAVAWEIMPARHATTMGYRAFNVNIQITVILETIVVSESLLVAVSTTATIMSRLAR